MSGMYQVRRFVAFFCLVMVLLAALAPGSISLPPAILVVLSLLVAIGASVLLPRFEERIQPRQAIALPAFSPRPPPAR
jgi:hypothetical protein